MDGNWRKEITKAVKAGSRDEALKLLRESTEHEAVSNDSTEKVATACDDVETVEEKDHVQMLQELAESKEKTCKTCGEDQAQGFCQQCEYLLCQKCISVHIKLESHEVLSLEDPFLYRQHFSERQKGEWKKWITKAIKIEDRESMLKLLHESTEHEAVRNLCVPLFGSYKYQKVLERNLTFEDAEVEGSMSLLDVAAANGWVDVCEELVTKHSCSHETRTITKVLLPVHKNAFLHCSPLTYAVREGHVDVVAYLVRVFKLQISDDEAGRALLALAVIHSRLEIVKHLITVHKISTSKVSDLARVILFVDEGWANARASPFIIACLQCCSDVIEYLVSEGHCDPREESNWKFVGYRITPVVAASLKGNAELIKYIAEVSDVHFEPYLHSSAEECAIRDPEVIRFLMRHANVRDGRWLDMRKLVMRSSVCSGLADCVQFLVENSMVDLNHVQSKYEVPYVDEAASNGHYDVVKYLVEKHSASEHCQVSESTMCAAASSGHLPLIEFLTMKREGYYLQTNWQKSALYIAAGCGNLNLVEYLIKKYNLTLNKSIDLLPGTKFLSPKVTAVCGEHFPDKHESILPVAAERGHLNIVKYLINQWNHDPNKTNAYSQTALHSAAFNGHLPVVEHLLNAGCHISPDTKGNTPLHFACWQGHVSIVKCLIEQCQLDPYMSNRLSQSPLCLAIEGGHLVVVEYLADELTIVEPEVSVDDQGNNALHIAAYGGHINMVDYVIEKWVVNKLNTKNKDSQTPLHVAICRGNLHVAEYLIKKYPGEVTCTDAPVDGDGNTALHVAVKCGSLITIKYLMEECKFSPNTPNRRSLMPLHVAFCGGKMDIAEYLIEEFPGMFACTDAFVDQNNNTALHIAAKHGSLRAVKYLINECNLSPYSRNDVAHTPLYVAIDNGNLSIVKWLFSKCSSVIPDAPVDDKGNTALHVATKHGHLSVTKCLINDCNLSSNKKNLSSFTPLQVACGFGKMVVAEYLIKEFPGVVACTDAPVDRYGNTALHVAVKEGSPLVIKYLINESKLSPYKSNNFVESPLHIAIRLGSLFVVKCLFSECSSVIPDAPVDYKGNTALHVAIQFRHLDIIKCLVNECKLSPNKTKCNSRSLTPLHIPFCFGRMGVAEYLIKEFPGMFTCTDAPVDRNGNTALHVAVKVGSRMIIKYLINDCNLDPYKRNSFSETPLYIAVRDRSLFIVKWLFSECSSVIPDAPVDHKGNTALHVAILFRRLDFIKCLVNECKLSPYKSNFSSETPLHIAVRDGNLPIVKCLFSECSSVIPDAPVDDKGNTALHVAAMHGSLDVVAILINEYRVDPNQLNKQSSTPLHLAVMCNHLPVVKYFLDEKLCDSSILNYSECLASANKETSLFLITEYDVKGYFPGLGLHSHVDKSFKLIRDIRLSFPVHSFTKLFLLGDPAAGKSTLVNNFKHFASNVFPSFFGQVSGVESHTAGIIPITIQSTKLGNLVVYDLAGHREFYSSHLAIMHKVVHAHPAIFMCVVDLSKSDKEIEKSLRFWFNFIIMGASGVMAACCEIVVVGSHADLLSKDDKIHKKCLVENISQLVLFESFGGVATLDCRELSSPGLTSLIALISKAQVTVEEKVQCRTKASIPVFCHMLMKFLNDLKVRKDGSVVYSLTDLSQLTKKENQRTDREQTILSIPSSTTKLAHFLTILNDRGLVLYFKGSTDDDSWVVVDNDALFSQINAVIFAPINLGHGFVTSNIGIANSSHITKLFPKFPPQVIIGVLKRLEFCHEIDPSHLRVSNLSLESSRSEFSLQEGDQLLFFPSCVSVERSIKLWGLLQFCWYLECQGSDQFLPTRYLQLLILKLASFSFKRYSIDPWQVDERMCTVWKNGIRWVNENGIEMVVEVLDHCTIVQLVMTCPEGMMVEHCRHRSMIIKEILTLQQELCPSVALHEMLVPPMFLQNVQYPFPPLSQFHPLNIKHVAQCAVEKIDCSIFADSFEPYQYLGKSLIQSLFTKGSVKVSDPDLLKLAAAFGINLKSRRDACIVLGIPFAVLESKVAEMPCGEQENAVRVCQEMFMLWLAYEADGGTYKSLNRRFDMFSVFAGRNPLDLAKIDGRI